MLRSIESVEVRSPPLEEGIVFDRCVSSVGCSGDVTEKENDACYCMQVLES
jgi:hypothetical protein